MAWQNKTKQKNNNQLEQLVLKHHWSKYVENSKYQTANIKNI